MSDTNDRAEAVRSGDEQAVVAVYDSHDQAEDAVHRLDRAGIPVAKISIVGRDWQVREDVQGYYRPSDAAVQGAGTGAWFGGLFGFLMGFGLFVIPIGGAIIVLGPLAGLIAGAIAGAGVGALVSSLMALGIPEDQAIKYQSRVEAGEFLVVVHGSADEVARAQGILQGTSQTHVQTHRSSAV